MCSYCLHVYRCFCYFACCWEDSALLLWEIWLKRLKVYLAPIISCVDRWYGRNKLLGLLSSHCPVKRFRMCSCNCLAWEVEKRGRALYNTWGMTEFVLESVWRPPHPICIVQGGAEPTDTFQMVIDNIWKQGKICETVYKYVQVCYLLPTNYKLIFWKLHQAEGLRLHQCIVASASGSCRTRASVGHQ